MRRRWRIRLGASFRLDLSLPTLTRRIGRPRGTEKLSMQSPYSPLDHPHRPERSPPLVPLPLDDAADSTLTYYEQRCTEAYDPRTRSQATAGYGGPYPYDTAAFAPPYLGHSHEPQPSYPRHFAPDAAYSHDDYYARTSPATTPYAVMPPDPYAAGASNAGPSSTYFPQHQHTPLHIQRHVDYYATPQSPYDPAVSTSAYRRSTAARGDGRKTSPASSGGGAPSPNLDYEVARREREREDVEREAGRREIEERERVKREAAWRRQSTRHERARVEPSSPEHTLGVGYRTLLGDYADDAGPAGGLDVEEEDDDPAAADNLEDLLREVRGDLVPALVERGDRDRSDGGSGSHKGGPYAPRPWNVDPAPPAPDRRAYATSASNSPRRSVSSSTSSETLQYRLYGNTDDGPDPKRDNPPRASSSGEAKQDDQRPLKRARHGSSTPRTEDDGAESQSALEDACRLPRKFCADYARARELPLDAETRMADREPSLGEENKGQWSLFGEVRTLLYSRTAVRAR